MAQAIKIVSIEIQWQTFHQDEHGELLVDQILHQTNPIYVFGIKSHLAMKYELEFDIFGPISKNVDAWCGKIHVNTS